MRFSISDMTELTERQLRVAVRSSVRQLVKHCHDQGSIPTMAESIQAAEKEVRARLVSLNPSARSRDAHVHDEVRKEIDRWMLSVRENIHAIAEETLRSSLAEVKSRDISAVSIRAIVEDIIRQKGFSVYRFTPQSRRVKVGVKLPRGRWFGFCIRHAHLQDDLSHVAEGLDCALRLSGLFDRDTTII